MNPATIVREAQADGVSLSLAPAGTLKATGDGAAVNRWLAAIREHKAEIIVALKAGASDTATAVHWRWLILFSDRDPLEAATIPPSTRSEMLALYPDAIAAEPFATISQRPPARMTAGDEAAVRAWLEQTGETDAATVADVLRQCQRDAEARRYFIGRAAAVHVAVTRSCMTCRDFARPGLSSGYCGGGRAGLLPAYGDHHPLRQLPEDGGASCEEWRDYA